MQNLHIRPYESSYTRAIALQAIEVICLYTVAQLAACVNKNLPSNNEGGVKDMAMEDVDNRGAMMVGLAHSPQGVGRLVDMRTMREWRDLAIDFNLVAKNAKVTEMSTGSKDVAGAGVMFDVITRFTVGMMDKLEKQLRRP